jgi:hypothetical protein
VDSIDKHIAEIMGAHPVEQPLEKLKKRVESDIEVVPRSENGTQQAHDGVQWFHTSRNLLIR